MPLWRRLLNWAGWTVVAAVVLVVLFFTQTSRGQRIVLDEVLVRARGYLAGELTVQGVRSSTLFFGLTLRGVRLDAEGGRRFLEADSVVLRYSPLSLAIGSPRLRSTTFHGLNLEISRYAGDDFSNVNRIVAPASPQDSTVSAPQTVGLGRIAVRHGTVEILTPAEDAPEPLTVPAPDGGRLRRIALENVDLDLERTFIRSEGPVMVDANLASLSTSVFVLEQPLVIREATGALTFGDRGLRVEEAAFRLPGSYLEGRLGFGPDRPGDPWILGADFRSADWSDLADIGWVEPRMPSGRFRGLGTVRIEDGIQIGLTDVDVQADGSNLSLDGGVTFTDVMTMRALTVTASPLDLALVQPWVEQDLPFDGALRGNATLGGTLADLSAAGRMTFTPEELPEAVTTADFSGTLHAGSNPGGTSLELRLDPFDYRVLEPLWAGARNLGTGRATLFLEGRADDGMLLVADVTHRSSETAASRAVGRGVLRRDPSREWIVDMRAELAPLSLPMLGRIWPEIDLPGEVRGPVTIDGRLTDLHLDGDLTSDAGRLVFDVVTDMTAPADGYTVEADAEELDLAAFTSSVPTPSVVSGHLSIDGSGLAVDSLAASALVALRSARVGGLAVDSARAGFNVGRGLLTADSLSASVAGILINGAGSLGLTEDQDGEARLSFSGETLLGLRPVFMGDSILVADTLTPLEQDALEARGIDLDTLPTSEDVRMAGGLQGTAQLNGWLGDLDVDLLFDLTDAAYGHNSVDTARVSLVASGLPETLGAWDVGLAARGVLWGERDFEEVRFDGSMLQRAGQGALEVLRRPGESYHMAGAFALDSLGGQVQMNDAWIEVNQTSWVLSHPTSMSWNESSLSVDSLEIRRMDTDPMTLTAAGTLTRGGDSDFRLMMEGLHLEQVLRIAQREDIDMAGHLDLDLDVTGPAEEPVIDARFDVEDPRFGPVQLTRLDGSLAYESRLADVELSAWSGERRVLTGDGVVPVDLALTEVESRLVEEEMDLTLRADSLDAGLAFVYLSALEDVVGTVSAEMRVRGTPVSPRPSGTVTLSNAAWTIDAIGVRHTGVSGDLLLQPNGTVAIKLAAVGRGNGASGTSTISGLVQLDTLSNPVLDLDIAFDRFLTVDRRDIQGRVSGNLELTGRYRLPVARGTLTLDEATLFVEEFARNADVVDLRSPLLYAPEIAVDTAAFVSQPLIAGLSNPFLDNLRMDVDLVVPRNLWLRSPDMNVELGGDLIVLYDRAESDLVLVGELEALRGSYTVFGRTFEVDGGTASFLGQPGVNPTLDIQALTRVRRQEGGPLEISATVGGTLVEPLVTLSTEEAGLSQADLVSYLVFGQSIGEAGASGQTLADAGVSYAAGTLVNTLGTALAQEIPLVNTLDYLSFSQASRAQDYSSLGSNPGNVLGGTQVELGKYLSDRVFVIFVLGGTQGDQETGASLKLRGVRLELAAAENLFVEFFSEDRFLRSGSNFGSTDLGSEQIRGLFVFSEWGYGSNQQDQQQD
jgi:hypothetical protein